MLKKILKKSFKFLTYLFFPNRCPVCNTIIEFNKEYCEACDLSIPRIPDNILSLWSHCRNLRKFANIKLYFDGYIAPYYNEDGGKAIVYNYKLGKRIELADLISDEMFEVYNKYYKDIDFDFICGIPMPRLKRISSEFDHVDVLCEKLSSKTKIPYLYALKQIKPKLPQHSLSATERFKNVKGIYSIDDIETKNKTILLVDDISTTGASLNECAKILKRSGAKSVYCICATINQ